MRVAPLWVVSLALLAAACGGDSSDGFSGATINLTASGLSPNAVTVPSTGQVRFVNQDAADHQLASSDCGELASPVLHKNDAFTARLGTGPKSCTFSDGLNPSSATFKGTITVNGPGAGGGGGGGAGY